MWRSFSPDWLQISMAAMAIASLGLAAEVAASPFTLSAPIEITGAESGNPGVVGTLQPVGSGALGQAIGLSNGDVSFVTNDVLVFSLSLSAVSTAVDSVGVGANSSPFVTNPVGAGSFADSGGGNRVPSSVTTSGGLIAAIFDFIPNTVNAGETTVDLFVTYNAAGSALATGTTANFMISSGTDFTVQVVLAEVPEPASFLLLAGALGVLALRRRA